MDILAALLAPDQSGVLENGKMLGDRRLRHRPGETADDLAGGHVGLGEVGEDAPPRGGGKRLENLVDRHSSSSPDLLENRRAPPGVYARPSEPAARPSSAL